MPWPESRTDSSAPPPAVRAKRTAMLPPVGV
jgi:hypothetical protein